jgi:hypothetical protein
VQTPRINRATPVPEGMIVYLLKLLNKITFQGGRPFKFCQLFLQGVKAGGKVDKEVCRRINE